MRIAIVSGHFMTELGYQEVYLARAYSRLGHSVRVFTSTSISPSGKNIILDEYKPGLDKDAKYGFEILRLKTTFRLMSNVFAFGLRKSVVIFQPDMIIIIGLAKMFPSALLTEKVNSL